MARAKSTTIADIVEGAARVFQAKGFRNATIDDICLEVGVSRPTIYKYIDSKGWLLDAMVLHVTEELGERLNELRNSPLHPRDKVQAMVKLHIDSATDKRIYYSTVFSEQPALSGESLQRFRAWSHKVTHDFALLIDEYIAEESLKPRAETIALANLTLTMLTGLFRWYDPDGSTTPDALAAQVLEMLSGPLPGIGRGVVGSSSSM